jgi:plastocyanin
MDVARRAVVVVAAVAAAIAASGSTSSADVRTPTLGSEATKARVGSPRARGAAFVGRGRIVEWTSVRNVARVTAVAEVWGAKRQRRFVASNATLRTLADREVRTFAPSDARYVGVSREGGSVFFHYLSRRLAAKLSASPRASGDDRLYVVIVLDSEAAGTPRPVVAMPELRSSPITTEFSIAVVAGAPWSNPVRPNGRPIPPLDSPRVVVMTRNAYHPARLFASAGRPLILSFRNRDVMTHDFVLDDSRYPVHIFVAPGRTIQTSLFFRTPGKYRFHCSEPGHAIAGMRGIIVVRR